MCKKNFLFLILFLGLSALVGCDQIQSLFQPMISPGKPQVSKATMFSPETKTEEPIAEIHGTILAKINNDVITVESFDEKLKNLEAMSTDLKINTVEAKKNFLNELVVQELLVQEGRARGIDKKKEVKDAIDEFKKTIVARQLMLDETKGIAIEPSDIEVFYSQYKKEFATPLEIRAREIVVSSEATAKEILIALLQGGDFATIAKERSVAPSASKSGDLGFVKKEDKFTKLHEVISTLEVGGISQVFNGPDGYYIVKVEEKKGGTVPPLNEVFDQIKNGLLQQKQAQRVQELTDKLKRDAKIEIKEELLR